MKKSLYQILGVQKNASQAALEAAFKKREAECKALHNEGHQETSNELVYINHAYEILSDPEKRAAYDEKWAAMQFQPRPTPSVVKAAPSNNNQSIPENDGATEQTDNPNLVNCKTCKKLISKNAKTCPHCGEGNSVTHAPIKAPGCLSILVTGIFIFWLIGDFGKSGTDSNSASASKDLTPKYDKFNAQVDCEAFVKRTLKAPATADFAPHHELQISGSDSGPWNVAGYVDAQNSFGAKIRSLYSCTIHYQDNKAYLDNLSVN